MKKFCLLILFLSALVVSGWEIVRDGAPNAVIVLPSNPLPAEQYAAEELQYIIRKASGAELPLVNVKDAPAGQKQIILGRAAVLDLKELPTAGFKIKTTDNSLLLAGKDTAGAVDKLRTATGTLYAVYQWAESKLGVLWMWPDELGEHIPAQKSIDSGDCNLTVSPKLQFAYTRTFDWKWNRRLLRADLSRYINFAGCSSQGHAFGDWRKLYGKEHPDYFEMNAAGNRINDRYAGMCVSNPALHQQIVANWQAAKRPHAAVNAKENDAHGRCMCAGCLAWDGEDVRWPTVYYDAYRNVGERYARYYKAVWELASKINPDVQVGGYAYMNYVYAPRQTKLNKNIVVGFVDDLPFPRTPEYQKLVNTEIELWGKSGASLYLRPNYLLSSYAMPEIFYHQYADEFKLAYRNGMLGLDVDGPNGSWATVGPNLYVMSRLVIDPEQSVDQLMDQYYSGFGQAAPAVKKYFEYWENYTMSHAAEFNRIHETESLRKWFLYGFHYATLAHRFFPEKVYEPAKPLLDEAAKLAAGDPLAEKRVAFLKQGFEHSILCSRTSAVFADPESTNLQCQQAVAQVKEYRKGLMPCVANVKYFEGKRKLEDVAWVLKDESLRGAIALPEKWQVQTDPGMKGREAEYFRPDFNSKDWPLRSTWMFLDDQGETQYRFAWYRTTVKIPADRAKWRVILRVGAIDESGWTWVNGKQVGELVYNSALDRYSWEKPQEYDITDAVKFGEDNQITVLVENASGKGGLWKPSFIRFERTTDGEATAVNFPARRPYAEKITENGVEILKMTGQPESKNNAWLTSIVPLPYEKIGKEFFRLSADIKTQNLGGGEFWLVFREINADEKTLTYDGFQIKNDHDWKNYTREIRLREGAVKIALYAVAKNLDKTGVAMVKNVTVERLNK